MSGSWGGGSSAREVPASVIYVDKVPQSRSRELMVVGDQEIIW